MTLEQISWASQTVAALGHRLARPRGAAIPHLCEGRARNAVHRHAVRHPGVPTDDRDGCRLARIYRDGLANMGKLESTGQWRFGALMQMVVANWWYTEEFADVYSELR